MRYKTKYTDLNDVKDEVFRTGVIRRVCKLVDAAYTEAMAREALRVFGHIPNVDSAASFADIREELTDLCSSLYGLLAKAQDMYHDSSEVKLAYDALESSLNYIRSLILDLSLDAYHGKFQGYRTPPAERCLRDS